MVRQYPGRVCGFFFLLPLWEKVVRTKSVPDEGSASAETDPSPGCDALHRSHPLPQGERGRKLRRRGRHAAVDHDGLAGHEARGIRAEISDRTGDLIGLADPPQRRGGAAVFQALFVFP